MFKINLNIFRFGKSLIYMTSLNILFVIFSKFSPENHVNIIRLLNTLSFNNFSKFVGKIDNKMLIGLYDFYVFLMIFTFILSFVLALLYNYSDKIIKSPVRIHELFALTGTLSMHHLNIFILINYGNNTSKLFENEKYQFFVIIDILVLISAYYSYFNSIPINESKDQTYDYTFHE